MKIIKGKMLGIKKFKINGEMLGKASRFIDKDAIRPILRCVRIETSDFFGGARIVASDGSRLIIFIDPASDFEGPNFNLETVMPGSNKLSTFFKTCRKLRSNVKQKTGYVTIDPGKREAFFDDDEPELTTKISFNFSEFPNYKKTLGKVKRIQNRKTIDSISSKLFLDSKHAILHEEEYGNAAGHLHFVNVRLENLQTCFLLVTKFAILLTMPIYRDPKWEKKVEIKDVTFTRFSLLEKVNVMLSHEPKNPFEKAYKKKQFASEFGDIFLDIK